MNQKCINLGLFLNNIYLKKIFNVRLRSISKLLGLCPNPIVPNLSWPNKLPISSKRGAHKEGLSTLIQNKTVVKDPSVVTEKNENPNSSFVYMNY